MTGFDMLDPTACELDAMRTAGEAEESKHDCYGCCDRIGIPCLIARSCTRLKGGRDGEAKSKG